ncbi:MAG: hypothetical protein H6779_01720 [Candidatus Nomurabacteria bacterium]|nr:hypothetical protein [Candidatus Nomurabacteria bacterium]USN88146.1 MAG: hypothetical protein H6779_01720 [Candidatus Nomurabacteria bacterium]
MSTFKSIYIFLFTVLILIFSTSVWATSPGFFASEGEVFLWIVTITVLSIFSSGLHKTKSFLFRPMSIVVATGVFSGVVSSIITHGLSEETAVIFAIVLSTVMIGTLLYNTLNNLSIFLAIGGILFCGLVTPVITVAAISENGFIGKYTLCLYMSAIVLIFVELIMATFAQFVYWGDKSSNT